MKFVNTLEFHKNNPDISVETYIKRKRVELSQQIRTSKKIYLDLKFWILFRDTRTKRYLDHKCADLLNIIETLVREGKAICPISSDIFWEIQKQADSGTLKSTIDLVDDLSKGITIISLPERFNLEFSSFIQTKFRRSIYSLDELVWTKIPYIMGFANPVSNAIPSELMCAMQKAFIDQIWSISLKEFFGPMVEILAPPSFVDLSNKLNIKKTEHLYDHKSFKELFLTELAGILDEYKHRSEKLIAHLFEIIMNQKFPDEETWIKFFSQSVINIVYHSFRLNRIKKELPSFHVMAKLHAATRWDKKRILRPNDIYDIHHAIDAIPYFDYFLTEHSLKEVINNKNLGFKVFSCKAISDVDTAISELSLIDSK